MQRWLKISSTNTTASVLDERNVVQELVQGHAQIETLEGLHLLPWREPPPPLQLPLRVFIPTEHRARVIAFLQKQSWFRANPALATHGFKLNAAEAESDLIFFAGEELSRYPSARLIAAAPHDDDLIADVLYAILNSDPLPRAKLYSDPARLASLSIPDFVPLATKRAGEDANKTIYESVRESAPRRVDIALQRGNTSVHKNTELAAGGRYRLQVRIGSFESDSLMSKPPDPIDPLLPKNENEYALTVELDSGKFTLEGEPSQPILLHREGPSNTAIFTIVAPVAHGPAQLFVAVKQRGNVLQNFVLDAIVAAEERNSDGDVLTARMIFSNSAAFTNLETFKPRAISISVGEQVRIKEVFRDHHVALYRRVLERATRAPGAPETPRFPTDAKEPNVAACVEILRELGRLGADLHDRLYTNTPSLKSALRRVRDSEGETIQILRCDRDQTFPWPAVYDYPPPKEVLGVDAPVCLAEAEPCSCKETGAAWCARGFWGYRHQIEELLGGLNVEDRVTTIAPAPSLFTTALGFNDDYTKEMLEKLRAFGSVQQIAVDRADTIEALWSADRGRIAVVLGHLETKDVVGEVEGPRIVFVKRERWLDARSIVRYEKNGRLRWEQPRSLIMLLACSSAVSEATAPVDLVNAFDSAGAAAVIATECTVFTGLAARTAREVCGAMAGAEKKSLGAAMLAFRRTLLSEKNPLGLVFTAIGSADLILEAP